MVVEYNLDVEEECPLCIELLNHDLNFFPCECAFQVILTILRKVTNKLYTSNLLKIAAIKHEAKLRVKIQNQKYFDAKLRFVF